MWRALALLCFACLPGVAVAQTVQIRSGEHDTFSRLTMALPKRVEWQVTEVDGGVDLILKSPQLTLDTSAIFTRIPQDRLTAATWSGPNRALQLRFTCACEADVFWHGASLLVLDIRDAPDTTEADPAPEMAKPAEPATTPLIDLGTPSRVASLDLVLDEPMPMADPPEPEQTDASALTPEVRDRLLHQVGRAASQGLLTPRLDHAQPRERIHTSGEHTRETQPEAPVENMTTAGAVTDHINLKAESSIDRDFLSSLAAQQQTLTATGCLADDRINVASWGNDAPFGTQVAALRLQLTGEFDAPDPAIAKQLTRLYLYFGFGAEARVLLDLMSEEDPDKPILRQLATIAEKRHAGPGPNLLTALDCPSAESLWSALSYQDLPTDRPIDSDAILRAFSGLPEHLRAYYGPTLVQRFLRADRKTVATKLLRIINRNEDTKTPQSELAAADLHSAKGEDEDADAALATVVESNSEPTVDALIQMIDQRFTSEREISYELAQLAGAYAYEHQDAAIGPTLDAAYVRALMASGATDQAFAEFQRVMSGVPEEEVSKLQSDLMHRLVQDEEDFTFLRHALPLDPERASSLHTDTANAVADRLLQLGFADQAQPFLTSPAPAGNAYARAQTLLRARLALARQKPRRAIVELLGMTGADANLLRARARSMVGEHKAAYHLYAATDDTDEAQRQAWLGEVWAMSAEADNPVYSDLATLMTQDTEVPAEERTTSTAILADNRSLVDTSTDMRGTLQALLADNPMPEAAEK